jgi:ubiquinone/menaquinone biosynthesis C-methylase UbiE
MFFDSSFFKLIKSECQRVLAPHGQVCILSLAKYEKDSIPKRLYERLHVKFPSFLDCRPIYLKPLMNEAGFRVQSVSKHQVFGIQMDILLARDQE